MSHRFGQVFYVCLLIAGTLSSPSAQAQITLRYKFNEGEKLTYVVEGKQEITANVGGKEGTINTRLYMDVTWTIGAVEKDGAAKITQSIDRVRFTMDGPMGKAEFDTKGDKGPDDAIGKRALSILKAMVGPETTLAASARGEVNDVKLPKRLVDALSDDEFVTSFTAQMFKPLGAQGGVVLPKEAVKKGDTWTGRIAWKMGPLGSVAVGTKATYQGESAKDSKKLDQISFEPSMTLGVPPNSPTKGTLKEQDGKGIAMFDNEKGQMVETTTDQNFVMEFTVNGQTITTKTKQAVGWKLVSAK